MTEHRCKNMPPIAIVRFYPQGASLVFTSADGGTYGIPTDINFCPWCGERVDSAKPKEIEKEHADQLEEIERLEEALLFYANPETYHAIGFLPDPPCGDFIDDFSDDHNHPDYHKVAKPGKRAREALGGVYFVEKDEEDNGD